MGLPGAAGRREVGEVPRGLGVEPAEQLAGGHVAERGADADLDVTLPRKHPQVAGEAGREADEHRRVPFGDPPAGHRQPARRRRAEEGAPHEARGAVGADHHVEALAGSAGDAKAAVLVDGHDPLGAVPGPLLDRASQEPRVEEEARGDEHRPLEGHVDRRPLPRLEAARVHGPRGERVAVGGWGEEADGGRRQGAATRLLPRVRRVEDRGPRAAAGEVVREQAPGRTGPDDRHSQHSQARLSPSRQA